MLQKVYNQIFPPTCALCDSASGTALDLCQSCLSMLPYNHHCCHLCAKPIPTGNHADTRSQLCGECLTSEPPHFGSYVPFLYEAPADFMVQQLKYQGSRKFGRLMGDLLATSAPADCLPDLLVPVPQHRERYLERGFNHAAEIAESIGHRLSIPVDTRLVIKTDARPPQSGLSATARVRNMRGAFRANREVRETHVAIVDDVLTTGATTDALTRALITAGCDRVSIWAFARTVRPDHAHGPHTTTF